MRRDLVRGSLDEELADRIASMTTRVAQMHGTGIDVQLVDRRIADPVDALPVLGRQRLDGNPALDWNHVVVSPQMPPALTRKAGTAMRRRHLSTLASTADVLSSGSS